MFNSHSTSRPVGMDKRDLQDRLCGQPEVLSPNKPRAMKVIHRKPPQQEHSTKLPQHRLEPLPALSAYQKRKNEEMLKFTKDEELPAKHVKEGHFERISKTPSLPELPGELSLNQHALPSLRMSSQTHPFVRSHPTESFYQLQKRRTSSRRLNQSALFVNTDPSMVITKYFPPLESITDPLLIVERLKKEPQLGFVYLTPVNDSFHYNPYNLR